MSLLGHRLQSLNLAQRVGSAEHVVFVVSLKFKENRRGTKRLILVYLDIQGPFLHSPPASVFEKQSAMKSSSVVNMENCVPFWSP